MSNLLISFAEQQNIKKISLNKESDYDQLASEVQEKDLKILLGVEFYQDLVQNQSNYDNLLDGSNYVIDDFTYIQKGLKHVLAYFIHAEYAISSKNIDTFAGFRQKNIPESQAVQFGTLKAIRNQSREVAFSYFEDIRRMLDNDSDTYKYWNCRKKKRVFKPRITKVG